MSNLLLEDDRKSTRRDYLIRLFATFLLLLSASAFIGAVLLLPSFFLVESQKRTLIREAALEKLKVSDEENPRAVIRDTERKVELLADIGNREKVGALLASLIEERPSGIKLTSITYVRGKDAGTLVASGVAATRSTLINFSGALERNRRFTGVELPVSNLASNRDILFSLSFKVIP